MSEYRALNTIAYDHLRKMIYASELEFNKVYSETKLAAELSISRTPIRDALNRLAQEKQATCAQISLAWMICKKPWIIPIPGSRKPERLRENLGAGEIILTTEEISDIDSRLDGMEFDVFGGHSGK